MIREEKFVQSHAPYAVDLDSFRPRAGQSQARIGAVWFRRRRGGWGGSGDIETVACAGYINECLIPDPKPTGAADFLARMTDGRYGGDCRARWDGHNLWCLEDEAQRAEYMRALGPMLAAYPALPEGFDGWWTFRGC